MAGGLAAHVTLAPGARECCKPWLDSVWVRHPGSSWSSFQQALQMSFLRSVSPKIDQARGRGAGVVGGGTDIGPILDPISALPHASFNYPNEDVAQKLDKDWVT